MGAGVQAKTPVCILFKIFQKAQKDIQGKSLPHTRSQFFKQKAFYTQFCTLLFSLYKILGDYSLLYMSIPLILFSATYKVLYHSVAP